MSEKADPELAELRDQIIELQSRYTHQERLVQQLDDIIREQQDQIDGLNKQVQQLHEKVDSVDSGLLTTHQYEKPPHY